MLKKLICTMTALLFMTSCPVPASAETAQREIEVDVPPVLLVLGDSIATGYGLEGYNNGKPGCDSYANLLAGKFKTELPDDSGAKLTNLAVDGMTSEGLLAELKAGNMDAALKEADCITVSIGGNDLLHSLWDFLADRGITDTSSTSVTDVVSIVLHLGSLKEKLDTNLGIFEKNLGEIASYINAHTEGTLIIQTLYDPFQSFTLIPGFSGIAKDKIGKLDEYIRVHAGDAGSNYTVCDVAPEFEGKSNELTNIGKIDIHPNADGHKVIADCLEKTIRAGKYTYTQTYEIEETAASVSASDTDSKESGSNWWIWLVLGLAGGGAAVSAVAVVIAKKRGKAAE